MEESVATKFNLLAVLVFTITFAGAAKSQKATYVHPNNVLRVTTQDQAALSPSLATPQAGKKKVIQKKTFPKMNLSPSQTQAGGAFEIIKWSRIVWRSHQSNPRILEKKKKCRTFPKSFQCSLWSLLITLTCYCSSEALCWGVVCCLGTAEVQVRLLDESNKISVFRSFLKIWRKEGYHWKANGHIWKGYWSDFFKITLNHFFKEITVKISQKERENHRNLLIF